MNEEMNFSWHQNKAGSCLLNIIFGQSTKKKVKTFKSEVKRQNCLYLKHDCYLEKSHEICQKATSTNSKFSNTKLHFYELKKRKWNLIFLFLRFYIFVCGCMNVFLHIFMCTMCIECPLKPEFQRVAMWVWGTESGSSSAITANALNQWAIYPVLTKTL